MQEVGETRDAIIQDDEKKIQQILEANKHRHEKYWIVIYATPAKGASVDGKMPILKHIKAYTSKPKPQVGMMIGEVSNEKGTIDWEVNLHDKPFGYGVLGIEEDGKVAQTTSIPGAYLYT